MMEIAGALSNTARKMEYSKHNTEKLIAYYTNKYVEVLLSYTNAHESNITHFPATNELIGRVSLYLAQQQETLIKKPEYYSKYYLVMNINQLGMVNIAYLCNLYYSTQSPYLECSIMSLINFLSVRKEMEYLDNTLEKVLVNVAAALRYNDDHIIEAPIEKVIEHLQLKILYLPLYEISFEEYKRKLADIYDQELECLKKTHSMILDKLSIADQQLMNLVQLDHLCLNCDEKLSVGECNDYAIQDI